MTHSSPSLASMLQNKGLSLTGNGATTKSPSSLLQKLKSFQNEASTQPLPSESAAPTASTIASSSFSGAPIITSDETVRDITRTVGYTMPSEIKDVIRECTNRGMRAQDRFSECIVKNGFLIKAATKEEDINSHIDFFIKRQSDGAEFSVDVKAKRTLKVHEPSSNIDWIFIEVKNVMGARGWIYGDADLIAFEREDCFLVVDRKSLLDFLVRRCDLSKRAPAASEAYYIAYSRDNRADLITMMNVNDLAHCKCVKFDA